MRFIQQIPAFRPQHRLAMQLVALVVLVALLSGGAVGVVTVDRARLALRDDIRHSSLAAAELAASLAGNYMGAAEGELRELGASAELRTAATQQNLSLATPKLELWLAAHPEIAGVGLVDLAGVTRATGASDKSSVNGLANTERDWFRGVIATGEPSLGVAGMSPVSRVARAPYGVPLRDDDGTLRGVLIGSISLQALSAAVTGVNGGVDARASLLDTGRGLIMAHADPSRILQSVSGKNEAARLLGNGERGFIENVNSTGQQTLSAFAPVPGLSWGVLVQQPSAEAFAPVDDMVRQALTLIAIAVLVSAAVGAVLAFGITRPIRALRSAVEGMIVGDLRQRVGSARNDELGELGRGFDRMADHLQQTLSELQEGEGRFRGLISAAFDGFAIHKNGRILEASDAFGRLFGYGSVELVGRFLVEVAAPETRPLMQRNIAAGLSTPYDGLGQRKNGESFHMELVDNACRFDGGMARMIAVRDVTPRKLAEQQRRRIAAIVNASSDAIVGASGDPLRVTDWNGGAERLFGYLATEIIGQPIALILPPELPLERAEIRGRLLGGERIENLETVRVHKDGSRVPVSISISQVVDQDGHITGNAMVAHDIAERKASEAALQESEARYRRLVESSRQGILVHDGQAILYANRAAGRLAGVAEPAELLGTVIWDLIHPDDLHGLQQELERLERIVQADKLVEARLVRRGGEVLDTEISAMPTLYRGRPAFQTIIDDITPRKSAERLAKNLAQAEKLRALGQMATGIAHDLNQSLMLVASYSDLAKRALESEPPDLVELSDLFTTATQAALDGGEAVKRLLLFTRRAAEPEGRPVELAALVRDVAQMTAPRWRDTTQAAGFPITLHVEASGHPTIRGSAAQLRDVLTNLIFNSVDALPHGGTIRVTVSVEAEHAVIRLIDSGMGMTPEVQARIFEPFYTTKGGSGTGLGLAMVFGIVEQHGGSIHVVSTVGQGTTFQLTFPLLDADLSAAPQSNAPAAPRLLAPLRILAVDDEPAMTKAVVRMLRPGGHLVSVAGSGEEALESLRTNTFDVVISDMGMGAGMNGWELASAVKDRWPCIRFLLATGWGAAIDPAEARTRGVEAVLAKPYRPVDLEQALAGPAAA